MGEVGEQIKKKKGEREKHPGLNVRAAVIIKTHFVLSNETFYGTTKAVKLRAGKWSVSENFLRS